MTTIKTTYRNIENETQACILRVLTLVYAEMMAEEDDADITIITHDSQHYEYTISTGDSPYDMHDKGTLTIDHYYSACLVEITETEGDPMKCVVNLDNNYIYYFH
jgi:hypothetical protein